MSVAELEVLRGPLTGYCYRFLGSSGEAEDAVQETMLRAVRAWDSYDPGRARLSTWVFRIATNVCLDLVRGAGRRALPWDFGPAAQTPELGVPQPAGSWVEPLADSRLRAASDPAEIAVHHETLRLAFIAALQRLPPRQRVALLLRDVLAFSAADAATVMETSTAAVNSAVQRARATLAADPPRPADVPDLDDAGQQELLRRYITAFQTHDVDALLAVLAEDARSGMPPFTWWLDGRARIGEVFAAGDACDEDRLLIGEPANGCWTLGQYRPGPDGALVPFALLVVELRSGLISQVVTFLGYGDHFDDFGLPAAL